MRQFPFQPGDLRRAESRAAGRSLRQDPGLAAFSSGPAPPLHRPLAHPQRSRDLPVLLPAPEAFHGLQPDPLPRAPPSVGQPTALRVSHAPQLPEATDHRQKNSADITRSSSVAHETACTLRDSGDRPGAIRHFRQSIRTRGAAFRRTHAVTLGYLGATQINNGSVEAACATWSGLLDAMDEGIYSGRTRQAVFDMRKLLSPYRHRAIPAAMELDARAVSYLTRVD